MKNIKVKVLAVFILGALILYYLPFILGHEGKLLDRYKHNTLETPLFVVYFPMLQSGDYSRFSLLKTAVRLHRHYNISRFDLVQAPFASNRLFYISKVSVICSSGMCITYDFMQANQTIPDTQMQLIKAYLKEPKRIFSKNDFYQYAKNQVGETEARALGKLIEHGTISSDFLQTDYQHYPLERFFFPTKTSE